MSRRVACLMLLAAFIAVAASSNPETQKTEPTRTEKAPRPVRESGLSNARAIGHRMRRAMALSAMKQISRLIHPLGQVFLMILDSWMRHYRHKALPCKITSFVPLRGTCTPVQ